MAAPVYGGRSYVISGWSTVLVPFSHPSLLGSHVILLWCNPEVGKFNKISQF